jgi:hypothetical protein
MNNIEVMKLAMKLALDELENNRRTHHYCEDPWYSCPKHEDGCANEAEGDKCNCGADEANAEIDKAITTLRQAIAEAEQEQPVTLEIRACGCPASKNGRCVMGDYGTVPIGTKLYTAPPPRQPLPYNKEDMKDLDINQRLAFKLGWKSAEAAHGIGKEKT